MYEHEDLEFVERLAAPLRRPEPVEPRFESRLRAAVQAAAANGDAPWRHADGGASSGGRRWLTARRHFAIAPLTGLAAAAGFAAIVAATTLLVSRTGDASAPAATIAGNGPQDARHGGHFAFMAPTARTVTLVGDFNGWDAAATPLRRGAIDGLWTVTLPLADGSYQYAFVVDRTAWVADPVAPVKLEDEFGAPSSLMIVRGGGGST